MNRLIVKNDIQKLLSEAPEVIDWPALINFLYEKCPTTITYDSRYVTSGSVFVALPGITADGHNFIDQAIHRGASLVIGTRDIKLDGVPYFRTTNSRLALAYIAAWFYRFPADQLTMIGVTGTDGKTSTVNFIFEILKAAKISVGMISTVNAVIGNQSLDTGFHVTTPEAPEIQSYLSQMVSAKPIPLSHAIIETTSHGLAQHRVAACNFDIGVVTNITHEHLDFHHTYENYREAKASLFVNLEKTPPKNGKSIRLAVLNRDDPSFGFLYPLIQTRSPNVQIVSYGIDPQADFRAENVTRINDGLIYDVEYQGTRNRIQVRLSGDYNISNSLAAISTCVAGCDISMEKVFEGINNLDMVPGRMEKIDLGQPFTAFVDFAHTPNALKHALYYANKISKSKVIAVFGSAGLRDREKRKLMAEIGIRGCDCSILTAEDPRTEDLGAILSDMQEGAISAGGNQGKNFFVEPDRRMAIKKAVTLAKSGDIVIVLGKGHESSMCFGDIEYPWDDRIALQAAIAELLNIDGPAMPYLPN